LQSITNPMPTLRLSFLSKTFRYLKFGRLAFVASCLCLLSTMTSSPAEQKKLPVVPLINHSVSLDGVIDNKEWSKAFILDAVGSDAPVRSRFHLMHDNRFLWVAVDCQETDSNRPTAQLRHEEAELSVDDAVEVALGLPGGVSRELNMGGYEGAMAGELAPLVHLYQFAVNALGVKNRKYDEAIVPTPRFDAKITKNRSGWVAMLKIPFESIGLSQPAGKTLYANFLRYRPPGIAGWRGMNLWGGYRPYPVAAVRLAASADEVAVNETVAAPATGSGAGQVTPVGDPKPFEYFPLSNVVAGQVLLEAGQTATLQVAGASQSAHSARDGLVTVGVELPQRSQPDAAIPANLIVKNADGTVAREEKHSFKGEAVPEWADTEAGQRYLRDAVPAPWTAPQVQGQTVELAHGAIGFDQNALPQSIVGVIGELLAAPSAVRLAERGKPVAISWEKPVFSANGVRSVIHAVGRFAKGRIELRSEVDYDGFTIHQVRLLGEVGQIDRLQFVYPLKKEYARFMSRGHVQTILPIDAGGYHGAGSARLWLGAEEGGLAIASDLNFYRGKDKQKEIEVKEEGRARYLIVSPIDGQGQLQPGEVLQFYTQPTPVRQPATTSREDYELWFEQWSDYQGYPDLKKMDEVQKRAKAAHEQGKQFLLYFNQTMAENAPYTSQYKQEFIALPERNWYVRSYDPGKGITTYVSSVRGPYGKLLLDGIDKLANEGNIDGIYMDGTSVDWDDNNIAHPSGNEQRQPAWNEPGDTRIIGTRNFLKRLRGIFHDKGKPFTLSSHTGGDLDIHTLGLVDFFVEGEQLSRNLPQFRIPRHQYLIGYSGAPWGYRTQFHDFWLKGRGQNWSLAYALIFNTDTYGASAQKLLEPFKNKANAFQPYWDKGQQILEKSATGRTSVSYYHTPTDSMLVATNFGFFDDQITLDGSKFAGAQNEWIDVLTGQTFLARDGKIAVTLKPYHAVALRPRQQVGQEPVLLDYNDPRIGSSSYFYLPTSGEAPPRAKPVIPELRAMDTGQWQVNTQGNGVTRQDIAAGAGKGRQLVLGSKIHGSEAQAVLEGSAISGDAEAVLKLKALENVVIRLEFGPVDIQCSNGQWSVRAPLDGWNDQALKLVTWPAKEEVELHLLVVNNQATIRLNGQAVVEEMALSSRPCMPRPLKICTWSGNSIAIELVKLTSKPVAGKPATVVHPVLR